MEISWKAGVKTMELLVDLRMQPEEPCRIEAKAYRGCRSGREHHPPCFLRQSGLGTFPHPAGLHSADACRRAEVHRPRRHRPACEAIRAEWLLASMARPDNIRYTDCLTLSSKYRWMKEDAEPVSRLRLRLEGVSAFQSGQSMIK